MDMLKTLVGDVDKPKKAGADIEAVVLFSNGKYMITKSKEIENLISTGKIQAGDRLVYPTEFFRASIIIKESKYN